MAEYLVQSACLEIMKCQVCPVLNKENKLAEHFCTTCVTYMCDDCNNNHTYFLREHQVTAVEYRFKQEVTCKAHPTVATSVCCIDCNMSVCTACIHAEHQQHRIEQNNAIVSKIIADLAKLYVTVHDYKKNQKKRLLTSKENIASLRLDLCKTKNQVREQSAKLTETIQKKTDELLSDVQEIYKSKIAQYRNEIDEEKERVQLFGRDIDESCKSLENCETFDNILDTKGIIADLEAYSQFTAKEPAAYRFVEFEAEDTVNVGYLKMQISEGQQVIFAQNCVNAVAIYDYTSHDDDEWSFDVDDIITDIERSDNGWWKGYHNGKRGLFPANYVKEIRKEILVSQEEDAIAEDCSSPTMFNYKF